MTNKNLIDLLRALEFGSLCFIAYNVGVEYTKIKILKALRIFIKMSKNQTEADCYMNVVQEIK